MVCGLIWSKEWSKVGIDNPEPKQWALVFVERLSVMSLQ